MYKRAFIAALAAGLVSTASSVAEAQDEFRPATRTRSGLFNPFSISSTVQNGFRSNLFAPSRTNPFTAPAPVAAPTPLVSDSAAGGDQETSGDEEPQLSSILFGGSGRPSYRPPTRSPFRPPPRPPF